MRLLRDKKRLDNAVRKKSFTVIVERSKSRNIGFKVVPWCKLYPKRRKEHRETLKYVLLSHGVGFSKQKGAIIVKNISNCLLLLKLVDDIPSWWRKTVFMIDSGEHKKPKNLLKIVKTKNEKSDYNGYLKWDIDSVKTVLEQEGVL